MAGIIIQIKVDIDKPIQIELVPDSFTESIFKIEESEALLNGEASYQIKEGYTYEYRITEGYVLKEINGILSQSKLDKHQGRITPGIYVGTLTIEILEIINHEKVGEVKLEVRSVKTSYRHDYRTMLEEITEKCTDLLMQANSPVSHYFTIDFNTDHKTLYQRFAFIKSILDSDEFNNSVHKFLLSPITNWADTEIEKDVRGLRRIKNSELRQVAVSSNRINLPDTHLLKCKLPSIPLKVKTNYKKETRDTPENRFIKYALESFSFFCSDFRLKASSDRLLKEATFLEEKLEQYLSHSLFKEISVPQVLNLNSPVLQRKEGYREIFRTWLMFDLAAKLIWHGGDDIYSGNKRDVAVLYEYWLFFKLLDLIKTTFQIETDSIENLIEETADGLGLKLKQGKYLPIKGVYKTNTRMLNVEFSYNRTFSGESQYPDPGSWTRNLRPDYTLSVWPYGIEAKQAEREELIIHIHFDAKYRVEDLTKIFNQDDTLKEEKEEEAKGNYKWADLLKMHTYRDAIRRTGGAYILYPGSGSTNKKGFHELIPGLGAFSIRPSKSNTGISDLQNFLNEIVEHFLNRTSQREKMSLKTFETYKDKNENKIKELLPEAYGINRSFLPDEIFVLVAFYKNQEHLEWILKNQLYNTRTGTARGSLQLSPAATGVKYILLHSQNETVASKIVRVVSKGPRIFSKENMLHKKYPNPTQDFYLVYQIEEQVENEFNTMKWDITKLNGYASGRSSALPFAVTLTELMLVLLK